MDVYLQIDDQLATEFSQRTFTLGRVCCQPICNCEWVFYDALTGKQTGAAPIPPDNTNLDFGYDCTLELSDCIQYCRKRAVALITADDPLFDKPILPMQQNNFLAKLSYGQHMCNLINIIHINPDIDVGINIYVRHTSGGLENYPFREDFHLGRLCCYKFIILIPGLDLDDIFPSEKCKGLFPALGKR